MSSLRARAQGPGTEAGVSVSVAEEFMSVAGRAILDLGNEEDVCVCLCVCLCWLAIPSLACGLYAVLCCVILDFFEHGVTMRDVCYLPTFVDTVGL